MDTSSLKRKEELGSSTPLNDYFKGARQEQDLKEMLTPSRRADIQGLDSTGDAWRRKKNPTKVPHGLTSSTHQQGGEPTDMDNMYEKYGSSSRSLTPLLRELHSSHPFKSAVLQKNIEGGDPGTTNTSRHDDRKGKRHSRSSFRSRAKGHKKHTRNMGRDRGRNNSNSNSNINSRGRHPKDSKLRPSNHSSSSTTKDSGRAEGVSLRQDMMMKSWSMGALPKFRSAERANVKLMEEIAKENSQNYLQTMLEEAKSRSELFRLTREMREKQKQQHHHHHHQQQQHSSPSMGPNGNGNNYGRGNKNGNGDDGRIMRSSASVSSLSMSKSQPIVSRGGMIPMHALTNKRTNTHTHSQYYNHRSHGDTDRFGNTYTHGHSHARIPLHGGAAESADPWSRDVQWFRSLSVSDRRKMKMKIKSLESQRRKGTESAGSKTRGSPAKERKPTHAYVDASGQRVDRSSEAFVEEYLSQHPLLQQLAERYIDPPSSTQDTHATGGDGRDGAGGPANDKSSNAMSKNWKSDGGFIVRSGVEGRAAAASPSLPPITSSSSSGQHTRGGTQGGPQKRGLGRAGRGRGTANNGKQNGGGQARERTRGQGGKQDSFARAKISDVTADIFFAALKDIQTDSASRRKLLELERIGITDSKDERNRRLVYYIVKELDNETKLMFVENVNKLRARAQKRGQGAGKAMGDVCFQSLMRKAEEQRILMPKPVRKKRIQKIARYDSMDSSWKKNRKAVNAATDAMGKASMLNDISGMRNILEDEPTHARGEHTTDTASKIMADIMAVKALKSQGVIVDEQDEERERRWREEAMLKIDAERNKPEVRSSFRKEKMEEIRKSLAGSPAVCSHCQALRPKPTPGVPTRLCVSCGSKFGANMPVAKQPTAKPTEQSNTTESQTAEVVLPLPAKTSARHATKAGGGEPAAKAVVKTANTVGAVKTKQSAGVEAGARAFVSTLAEGRAEITLAMIANTTIDTCSRVSMQIIGSKLVNKHVMGSVHPIAVMFLFDVVESTLGPLVGYTEQLPKTVSPVFNKRLSVPVAMADTYVKIFFFDLDVHPKKLNDEYFNALCKSSSSSMKHCLGYTILSTNEIVQFKNIRTFPLMNPEYECDTSEPLLPSSASTFPSTPHVLTPMASSSLTLSFPETDIMKTIVKYNDTVYHSVERSIAVTCSAVDLHSLDTFSDSDPICTMQLVDSTTQSVTHVCGWTESRIDDHNPTFATPIHLPYAGIAPLKSYNSSQAADQTQNQGVTDRGDNRWFVAGLAANKAFVKIVIFDSDGGGSLEARSQLSVREDAIGYCLVPLQHLCTTRGQQVFNLVDCKSHRVTSKKAKVIVSVKDEDVLMLVASKTSFSSTRESIISRKSVHMDMDVDLRMDGDDVDNMPRKDIRADMGVDLSVDGDNAKNENAPVNTTKATPEEETKSTKSKESKESIKNKKNKKEERDGTVDADNNSNNTKSSSPRRSVFYADGKKTKTAVADILREDPAALQQLALQDDDIRHRVYSVSRMFGVERETLMTQLTEKAKRTKQKLSGLASMCQVLGVDQDMVNQVVKINTASKQLKAVELVMAAGIKTPKQRRNAAVALKIDPAIMHAIASKNGLVNKRLRSLASAFGVDDKAIMRNLAAATQQARASLCVLSSVSRMLGVNRNMCQSVVSTHSVEPLAKLKRSIKSKSKSKAEATSKAASIETEEKTRRKTKTKASSAQSIRTGGTASTSSIESLDELQEASFVHNLARLMGVEGPVVYSTLERRKKRKEARKGGMHTSKSRSPPAARTKKLNTVCELADVIGMDESALKITLQGEEGMTLEEEMQEAETIDMILQGGKRANDGRRVSFLNQDRSLASLLHMDDDCLHIIAMGKQQVHSRVSALGRAFKVSEETITKNLASIVEEVKTNMEAATSLAAMLGIDEKVIVKAVPAAVKTAKKKAGGAAASLSASSSPSSDEGIAQNLSKLLGVEEDTVVKTLKEKDSLSAVQSTSAHRKAGQKSVSFANVASDTGDSMMCKLASILGVGETAMFDSIQGEEGMTLEEEMQEAETIDMILQGGKRANDGRRVSFLNQDRSLASMLHMDDDCLHTIAMGKQQVHSRVSALGRAFKVEEKVIISNLASVVEDTHQSLEELNVLSSTLRIDQTAILKAKKASPASSVGSTETAESSVAIAAAAVEASSPSSSSPPLVSSVRDSRMSSFHRGSLFDNLASILGVGVSVVADTITAERKIAKGSKAAPSTAPVPLSSEDRDSVVYNLAAILGVKEADMERTLGAAMEVGREHSVVEGGASLEKKMETVEALGMVLKGGDGQLEAQKKRMSVMDTERSVASLLGIDSRILQTFAQNQQAGQSSIRRRVSCLASMFELDELAVFESLERLPSWVLEEIDFSDEETDQSVLAIESVEAINSLLEADEQKTRLRRQEARSVATTDVTNVVRESIADLTTFMGDVFSSMTQEQYTEKVLAGRGIDSSFRDMSRYNLKFAHLEKGHLLAEAIGTPLKARGRSKNKKGSATGAGDSKDKTRRGVKKKKKKKSAKGKRTGKGKGETKKASLSTSLLKPQPSTAASVVATPRMVDPKTLAGLSAEKVMTMSDMNILFIPPEEGAAATAGAGTDAHADASPEKREREMVSRRTSFQTAVKPYLAVTDALTEFAAKADQGDPDHMFHLAYCYEKGHGIPQDYARAFVYYEKGMQTDHVGCVSSLGMCYKYGLGCEANATKAIEYYTKASELGSVDAYYNLAVAYLDGAGVEVDTNKAMAFFHKAADQGDADSHYYLGTVYEKGVGTISQDYKKAYHHYYQACKKGHRDATFNLAIFYQAGLGVQKGPKNAFLLFFQLARNNDADALYAVGHMYYTGVEGWLEKDPLQGSKCIKKAAKLGHEEAMKIVEANQAE